ncbi:MAG: hypothetical protein JW751_29570 [Polyangiaceae bacterium]|nr:hypothetical protein [Polyangiaceae bacterium]
MATTKPSRSSAPTCSPRTCTCDARACGTAPQEPDPRRDLSPPKLRAPTLALDTALGTCAATSDGVRCWGRPGMDPLDGRAPLATKDLLRSSPWGSRPAHAVAGAEGLVCVIEAADSLACALPSTELHPSLGNVTALAVDRDVACAVHDGGRASCWSAAPNQPTVGPTDVRGIADPVELEVDGGAACTSNLRGRCERREFRGGHTRSSG